MAAIDLDRLRAATQLCHVLAHENYFEFLTQINTKNGTCHITSEGTLSEVQTRGTSQYGSGSLASMAGLSYTEGEISQTVKVCDEAGLIGLLTDSKPQHLLLNSRYILDALLYQIELLGGGLICKRGGEPTPATNTLNPDERTLLKVLSSQLAQFVLYALRDKAQRTLADITATVYRDSDGKWASKSSIRSKVKDLSQPGGLLLSAGGGHANTYRLNQGANDQAIQLMSRLFNHFSGD